MLLRVNHIAGQQVAKQELFAGVGEDGRVGLGCASWGVPKHGREALCVTGLHGR